MILEYKILSSLKQKSHLYFSTFKSKICPLNKANLEILYIKWAKAIFNPLDLGFLLNLWGKPSERTYNRHMEPFTGDIYEYSKFNYSRF